MRTPAKPKPPPVTIRRVRDVTYDVKTQVWHVQLDCFHKLDLPQTEHSMKVVARWCPSCQYAARGTVSV